MEKQLEASGAIIALLFTYYVFETLVTKWRVRKGLNPHGCKKPSRYPHKDPILGLDLLFDDVKQMKKSNLLNTWVNRSKTYGYTFSAKIQTKNAICTVDKRNLQTVHALNSSHYGVQELRQPPKQPFLGDGVFNMDGPFWQHSRALIRPTFERSNVAHLTAFEDHFRKFLALIQADGKMVDLKPLLRDGKTDR